MWMALIFWFSTDRFSGAHTGSILESLLRTLGLALSPEVVNLIHFLIRKLAHLTAYAVLALLLFRALRQGASTRWRLRWAIGAFLMAAGYALLDEYHQSLTLERTASLGDSCLDMFGSLGALAWRRFSSSSRQVRDEVILPEK